MAKKIESGTESKNIKRLYRSEKDSMLAGVCGGIAEYFEVDPTLIRLIWVVGTLASFGFGILLYIIAAIIIPEKSKRRS
jgi:phage shock protein C